MQIMDKLKLFQRSAKLGAFHDIKLSGCEIIWAYRK